MQDNLQFYPTPEDLARKAWSKFKDKNFIRVLEPSAGNGDLAQANPSNDGWRGYRSAIAIDCCEIDIEKHPILRDKGFAVTGLDFLQMESGNIYSHIIMNPPFAYGAEHVLKAWDLLWSGEIVAIINAQTLRCVNSQARHRLAKLVEECGEVEFIQDAFLVEEAERKASVEVALIWLGKTVDAKEEIFGSLLEDLRQDRETGAGLAGGFQRQQEVALPASEIENRVLVFNAAVQSMRDAVFADARARHYGSLLGGTMAMRCSGNPASIRRNASVDAVQKEIGKRYEEIKDSAWAGILRGTNVSSRLSSKAQQRLEKEFDNIKKLEFTEANIYGFLCGLVHKQGEIQIDMVLDVFDEISRYHEGNTVFYKGWKSNSKHRTAARRIKRTRFILPGFHTNSWNKNLDWDDRRRMADFDKAFAMMDGKMEPDYGLVDLFQERLDDLRAGERLASSYFEVRYYPGAGTVHFFTTRPDLIDRLNRTVGRQRQWLPPECSKVSDDFWTQYEKAEKFDKEFRVELNKSCTSHWSHPLRRVNYGDEAERTEAVNAIEAAIEKVLERHGICPDFRIESSQQPQLLLAAA